MLYNAQLAFYFFVKLEMRHSLIVILIFKIQNSKFIFFKTSKLLMWTLFINLFNKCVIGLCNQNSKTISTSMSCKIIHGRKKKIDEKDIL